jgi:hypothetical protein
MLELQRVHMNKESERVWKPELCKPVAHIPQEPGSDQAPRRKKTTIMSRKPAFISVRVPACTGRAKIVEFSLVHKQSWTVISTRACIDPER